MLVNPKLPTIWFGGDYNPEQWPEEVWTEDVRLMKLAGVSVATVGVFSWATLQPDPDTYRFEWLDRVLDLLRSGGVHTILATPTASPPAWMAKRYPAMLPVDAAGARFAHASRRHYCPNSPDYRRHTRDIAERLAARYAAHPGLVLWHVDNEYGCHNAACYCDQCAAAFRAWLRRRYGDLDQLNAAWATAFWSQRYGDWSEIDPPRRSTADNNPSHVLDYRRFTSDSYLECFLEQKQILRKHAPTVPITTNMMGWFKGLDYFAWGREVDVASWDNYPGPFADPAQVAAKHDLTRSLTGGVKPFLLMEQTPSQVNWSTHNTLLRPGEMRLLSYQAVAHGADAVCYFQWRQGPGGSEKLHGAVVSHEGSERTRTFGEVSELGRELRAISEAVAGSETRARAAIVADWPSWWAAEQLPTSTRDLSYVGEVQRYYSALWRLNVQVDFVSPSADLGRYDLAIAPTLRIVTPETRDALERFVRGGGTLVLTCGSALTDETDRALLGGFPGRLRDLFGIWVEELDPLRPGMANLVRVSTPRGDWQGEYSCGVWCDLLHLEGAAALATFAQDFYAGRPAVTEHRVGKGRAIYVATIPEPQCVNDLVGALCRELGLESPVPVPDGVEVTRRWQGDRPVTFVINHNLFEVAVPLDGRYRELIAGVEATGSLMLPGRGVAVLA